MANDDLIYRNRLVAMFNEQKQCEGFPDPWYEGYNTGLETAITISEHMPFVNAVPVIYAQWIEEKDRSRHWHCSNCKAVVGVAGRFGNYCLYCGAKISGDPDE